MKFKGSIFFSALSVLAIAVLVGAYYPPTDNTEKEALLMQRLIGGLNQLHYQPQTIDDKFSEKVFDTYLDRIDSGKRWLTQSDVDKIAVYKTKIDDEANEGTYEFFNESLLVLDAGIAKTEAYYKEFLAQPFDFSKKEEIEFDGEKRAYAKTDAELKEYWRQLLKYDVMTRLSSKLEAQKEEEERKKKETEEANESKKSVSGMDLSEKMKEAKGKTAEKLEYKLLGKSEAEIEEMVRKDVMKTFDDLYERLGKLERSDRLSDYLNAITSVFDPHTVYFEPKDKETFDIRMSGRLEGIGAQLRTEGDFTKVIKIIPGGPAWKGKELEANDLIVKVTQKGKEDEALDITGMKIDDVVKQIRGKKGTVVILTVKKVDGTIENYSITRDVVILEETYAKSAILNSPDKVENIGYIKLPQFYADFNRRGGRACAADIAKELEKLKKQNVNGIILDLRNNGGGSLREVQKMSGFFIEEGPIVQVKSRGHQPDVLSDEDPKVQYSGPLVVMVNSFSASASEILAAALQDYGRAVIVGSNSTFGKGTVQRFIDLDRGLRGVSNVKPLGEVKLTIQKFYRVNGGSTQLKGVVPDIILPDNYHYFEIGEKEQDYSLAWTEIKPVEYTQNVTKLNNLNQLKAQSASRVKANPTFQKVMENAKRLKTQSDRSVYSLNMEAYEADRLKREAAAKQFKDMFKANESLEVSNLPEDLDNIKIDESKEASNEEWIKSLKKDAYIDETLFILRDMIEAGN